MDIAIDDLPTTFGRPLPVMRTTPLESRSRVAADPVSIVTRAVAELLRSEQLPPLSEAQVRGMIGRGACRLVRRVYLAHGIGLDEASVGQRADALEALTVGICV